MEQLKEIRNYIDKELLAPDAAKNMLMLLAKEMASLSHLPKRVKLIDEEPWRSEGVRVKSVKKNYLIYFWILDTFPIWIYSFPRYYKKSKYSVPKNARSSGRF